MHLGIPTLLDFYRRHCDEESLVLATIIATEGSTYRKPGAMMLVSREGAFAGMISGGCLEGDLLQHAEKVFSSGEPAFLTYDMHAGEDLVWSLGLGCDGVIHLMLQRLDQADGFGFLQQLEASHCGLQAAMIALVIRAAGNFRAGALALLDQSGISTGDPVLLGVLNDAAEDWPGWRYRKISLDENDHVVEIMLVHAPRQTKVLICGAGPDAVPVARVLVELGWGVQVVDHRRAYSKPDRFPAKCTVTQVRPEHLGESINLDQVDAVVIMSHHLENDTAYLGALAGHAIPYVGVLGPRARRDHLCKMAQSSDRQVHGPIGLDIGAELPAAIALSVSAEIHAVLNQRDGRPLTSKAAGNET